MSNDLESVVFGTAFESLVSALSQHMTPEFKRQARELGVDLDKVQPAYSLNTYSAFLRALGAHALGALPEGERHRELGRLFLRGFSQTPLGLAAGALAKLMGPRRALERMSRNFKQATNYLDAEFTAVSPHEVRLRTFTGAQYLARANDRSMLVGEYRHGLLAEMLALLGVKDGRVEVIEHHPERQDVTFRLTWS